MSGRRIAGIGLLLAIMAITPGCDEPKQVGKPASSSGGKSKKNDRKPAPEQAERIADEEEDDVLELEENDFVEANVRNRNPFRSFAQAFEVEAPKKVQRKVKMPDTSVDRMRLIAIISGVSQPRAMLTDPSGIGHVVQRGEYVGRAEVVETGGDESMPVTLNWKIHRIRPDEVVLAREDPTAPEQPPLTRVLPLHDEQQ